MATDYCYSACLIIAGQSIRGVMMTVIVAAVEKRKRDPLLRSTSSNYPIYAELIYGQQNGSCPGKERRLVAAVGLASGVLEVCELKT